MRRLDDRAGRQVVLRTVALACCLGIAALLSEAEDWRPWYLVVALGAVMMVADVVVIPARQIRISAGLMVQCSAMALLGPASAVAIGVTATTVESRVNHVRLATAMSNILTVAVLGLVGGVLFEQLGDRLGIDPDDTTYSLLVLPLYAVLMTINVALVIALHPDLTRATRERVLRESVLPGLPVEVISGLIAAAAVFAGAYAPLAAPAALLVVLLIAIPLERMLGDALVSDERAAEVASLALDRDRLLLEVMSAESRERARLAESLHDGPMQRLAALRQDLADSEGLAALVDRTIVETRAIISAFHPASVRERGFEASLRAAVEPFPAAAPIALSIDAAVDDLALAQSLALPVARELVINAVKHADPMRIDVTVRREDDRLVLEIDDDGVGIDSDRADRAVQAGHVGLAMVRRRVEDAGGQLEIATRPDGGTHSRVVLLAPPDV